MSSFGKSSVAGGADKTPKQVAQIDTTGLAGNAGAATPEDDREHLKKAYPGQFA